MGGAHSEVADATTDVILESARFDPVAVFRTGRRHRLSSEAGKRFERSVDPELAPVALARAAELLVQLAGGTADPTYTDVHVEVPAVAIVVDADLPDRVAGVGYPEGTTVRRLEQVGCTVTGDGVLSVEPPSWRPDLRVPADLVEEVLRLEGLEAIPAVPPSAPAGRGLTPSQRRRRAIGRALAVSGHVEVLPFPFLPAGVFDAWGLSHDDPRRATVRVLNPLESDRSELATTLIPNLVEMAVRNITRGQRDVALYAVGQVVLGGGEMRTVDPIDVSARPTDDQIAALHASLPRQPLAVAVLLAGNREQSGPWGPARPVDPSDAFESARIVAQASGVEIRLVADDHLPWHPGRCARIVVDGPDGPVDVGWAGELHPRVVEAAGLPARSCAVEIDLDALPIGAALPSPTLSAFPAVLQDVAVVVGRDVAAGEVQDALAEGAGPLLEDIRLFDVFTGERLGEGHKSLAFALRFRAPDRTLTEDEASEARLAAVAHAEKAVGARLR
jgi:phenylalanyl-tRNA synthetase beta chain